jgi:YesN/AraC family two-component response regulator
MLERSIRRSRAPEGPETFMIMTPASQARVLVVDDDPSFRETLQDWLVMEGYAVQVAADGLEASEMVRWEPFDVVVTDLKMPNMDGLGLLSRLEALTPDVRVIFLSGEATMADAIEALREGRSFDFLEKPLPNLDRLSQAIARAIALRPLTPEPTAPPPGAGPDHPVLDLVFAYINAHLASPIGLTEVASAVGYSPSYLTAVVREATGQPVMQWVTSLRLQASCRLLRETDRAIAQVAAEVGVPDAKYFSRLFKRAYGDPPQAWRTRMRSEA